MLHFAHSTIIVTGKESKATLLPDMEFVKNFTHQDVQAKSFTPQKCVICDSFFSQINSVNASNINNLGIFWL